MSPRPMPSGVTLPSSYYEITPVETLVLHDVVREWASAAPIHGTVTRVYRVPGSPKNLWFVDIHWDDGTQTTMRSRTPSGHRGDAIRLKPKHIKVYRAKRKEQTQHDRAAARLRAERAYGHPDAEG